jgi:DNA-binding Xre family transcriptional regulator
MAKQTKATQVRGEVKFINPEGLPKNPAFTNVVTVTGPVKTIYIGGQDAVDASGAIVGSGKVSYGDVQRVTGIDRSALYDWGHNRVRRYDAVTLAALCEYFHCTIGDLLVYTCPPSEKSKTSA